MSAPGRDDALRMWHDSELGEVGEPFAARIERFAALVSAAEREAVIQAAIDLGFIGSAYVHDFAAAIRARGAK